ncbi:MAG: RHS repeat-associated core domain-containing protein, partial [bacterium]|nr:RHS repeat-associated core domain-containing protein [bacterium]
LGGDHLGSTSLTTDSSGGIISEARYSPYGQIRWNNGTNITDFGFTSQRREGFGLYDYNARYYSPTLGRFISPDTIVPDPSSSGGFNRYRYTRNNPKTYT